jgi:hypothetical protein
MGFELRYETIPGAEVKTYVFAISAKLRTRAKTHYASGQCETNVGADYPAGNLCYVDCDGGGVSVQEAAHGESIYVYLKTPVNGIVMGSACDEGTAGNGLWLRAGTDDKVFVLNRAPEAVCQPTEKATDPRGVR